MYFFEKKNLNKFLLLALALVSGVALNADTVAQKPGGLAAAREREKAANVNRRKVYESRKTIRRQALEKQQDIQAKHYGVDTVPLNEIEKQTDPDRFTQTEAHLQVKSVRDLLGANPDYQIIPHLDTLSDCLAKEAELKQSHYSFYHTTESAWRVTQDLETQLFAYFNEGKKEANEEFSFLRFGDFSSQSTAQDFLVRELKENGLVDDFTGEIGAIILSVNLSLYGNIGFEPECTWQYFLREKKHREPDRATYVELLDRYGLSHKYIDDLLALPDLFQTKEKTLLQIFVPKDKVDQIGYLAWATGIPAHPEIHKWAREYVKNKTWGPGEQKGDLWSTQWLALHFKKEQEKNPMFKELMESVKEGDYSVDAFLKIYRNKPWELPSINDIQARLIFSPEILLNPNSGVKVYRYSTASSSALEEYSNKLNDIVNNMINEKNAAAQK